MRAGSFMQRGLHLAGPGFFQGTPPPTLSATHLTRTPWPHRGRPPPPPPTPDDTRCHSSTGPITSPPGYGRRSAAPAWATGPVPTTSAAGRRMGSFLERPPTLPPPGSCPSTGDALAR